MLLAAALTSRATRDGHVCAGLADCPVRHRRRDDELWRRARSSKTGGRRSRSPLVSDGTRLLRWCSIREIGSTFAATGKTNSDWRARFANAVASTPPHDGSAPRARLASVRKGPERDGLAAHRGSSRRRRGGDRRLRRPGHRQDVDGRQDHRARHFRRDDPRNGAAARHPHGAHRQGRGTPRGGRRSGQDAPRLPRGDTRPHSDRRRRRSIARSKWIDWGDFKIDRERPVVRRRRRGRRSFDDGRRAHAPARRGRSAGVPARPTRRSSSAVVRGRRRRARGHLRRRRGAPLLAGVRRPVFASVRGDASRPAIGDRAPGIDDAVVVAREELPLRRLEPARRTRRRDSTRRRGRCDRASSRSPNDGVALLDAAHGSAARAGGDARGRGIPPDGDERHRGTRARRPRRVSRALREPTGTARRGRGESRDRESAARFGRI